MVCLDAATGSEIWQVGRPSDGTFECKHSYASPTLYRDGQREFLLTHGADYIVAHDSERWPRAVAVRRSESQGQVRADAAVRGFAGGRAGLYRRAVGQELWRGVPEARRAGRHHR